MVKDTFKRRYLFKLSTNMVGLVINAFAQAIIPRGLGPKAYGDYNFLTNFFTQVISFFDMGTSTGLYAKLSQRPKEFALSTYYFYFISCGTLVMAILVMFIQLAKWWHILWPDQSLSYVYVALLLCALTWINSAMTRIADAYGLTVSSEMIKMFQRTFGLFFLIIICITQKLSLGSFFFYNYFVSILLAVIFYYNFKNHGYDIFKHWKLRFCEIKKYTAEFYHYSHPLFLCGLIGMIAGIFNRWLLQVSGGSMEQGFFGLSCQVGAVCFMFTSAMTPLMMREFSIAYGNKDIHLMAALFRKHIPFLYSITAILACFTAVNADKVTIIMGGGKFHGAILAVAVMAFYPIHQVYGQLSGSVFYASDRVKLCCNIANIFTIISIPVTYFLIAPREFFGLGAGALGLACATVLIQFLTVNVQLYYNSKLLKFSFWRYVAHQLASVATFLILSLLARWIIDGLLRSQALLLINFLCCGVLYLLITYIFVFFIPAIAGIRRGHWPGIF